MKVLNLYAGIGGNRKLWTNCEITAVEYDENIAKIYKTFFPEDNVIVGDAADYLAKHYDEFDFIWASPPCQSHSKLNTVNNVAEIYKHCRKLHDMNLYAEIIYLQSFFKGNWIVENVKPYYKPLITPTFCLGRHYFWSNKLFFDINISDGRNGKKWHEYSQKDWEKIHGFKLDGFKNIDKRQVLRNCVSPEIGKYIFDKITEA